VRLPWLAHDEAPGPHITIPQYRFNKTKQHTNTGRRRSRIMANFRFGLGSENRKFGSNEFVMRRPPSLKYEAPRPYITIPQYWFNKTKQQTNSSNFTCVHRRHLLRREGMEANQDCTILGKKHRCWGAK